MVINATGYEKRYRPAPPDFPAPLHTQVCKGTNCWRPRFVFRFALVWMLMLNSTRLPSPQNGSYLPDRARARAGKGWSAFSRSWVS